MVVFNLQHLIPHSLFHIDRKYQSIFYRDSISSFNCFPLSHSIYCMFLNFKWSSSRRDWESYLLERGNQNSVFVERGNLWKIDLSPCFLHLHSSNKIIFSFSQFLQWFPSIYIWRLLNWKYTPFDQYCVNLFLLIKTDNNMGKQLWNEKLGRYDFTLAFVFLLNVGSSSKDRSHFSSDRFSNMQNFISRMRDFISWIIWGQAGGSSTFLSRSVDLAFILFKHDQYAAAEVIYLPLLFFLEWEFGPFSWFLSYLFWKYPIFQFSNISKAIAHDGGSTFAKGEDIPEYSRFWWWLVHTSSSSRMLPTCTGSVWIACNTEGAKSFWCHSLFL